MERLELADAFRLSSDIWDHLMIHFHQSLSIDRA
jgi:hypothetical protein